MTENGELTMRPTITMSQDALTIYIFQPIFANPIGIINTKTSLRTLDLRKTISMRKYWMENVREAIQSKLRES
jgi:hypothetical protein